MIKIGDLVKIKLHEQSDKANIKSAKLSQKFRLLYQVIEIINDNQYKLKYMNNPDKPYKVQSIRNIIRLPDIVQNDPNSTRLQSWKEKHKLKDENY